MIFLTGDIHGDIDIHKLSNKYFPENKKLCKSDYVIIAGDFGLVWDGKRPDQYWLKWLKERNFTTLFVDGNHENFDMLNSYPVDIWNGGKVHFINDSVIHLMRGQVYKIEGMKIFCFGGAPSSDKEYRKDGISWWKQEIPSEEEYKEGIESLKANNWEVDYIITHTSPSSIFKIVKEKYNKDKEITEINYYFENIKSKTTFKKWFSGHDHIDDVINMKHIVLYEQVIEINSNPSFEQGKIK